MRIGAGGANGDPCRYDLNVHRGAPRLVLAGSYFRWQKFTSHLGGYGNCARATKFPRYLDDVVVTVSQSFQRRNDQDVGPLRLSDHHCLT
jgi:hypothetical protein